MPGRSTLDTQLVPENLGFRDGQTRRGDPAAFHEAMANIARIGLTSAVGTPDTGAMLSRAARFRLISLA